MKTKILLSFAISFFTAITTNAQITKGKYLLGGGFSYANSESTNNSSLSTNVQFGKFVKEDLSVGVIGSLAGSKQPFSNDNFTINEYTAGLFLRKYVLLEKKFYFFYETDLTYEHTKTLYYYQNIAQPLLSRGNSGTIGITPGISYSVLEQLQMELMIPFFAQASFGSHKTIDNKLPNGISAQEVNDIRLDMNLNSNSFFNFGIGFKFFLGK
jgi:hypothetical protein